MPKRQSGQVITLIFTLLASLGPQSAFAQAGMGPGPSPTPMPAPTPSPNPSGPYPYPYPSPSPSPSISPPPLVCSGVAGAVTDITGNACQLNAGATVKIGMFNQCYAVTNNSGKSVFAPGKTQPEFDSFCGKGPTNITGLTCTGPTSCAAAPPVTYSWLAGLWTTCAAGTQTRTVNCVNSSNAVVASSNCTGVAPAASQACAGCSNDGTVVGSQPLGPNVDTVGPANAACCSSITTILAADISTGTSQIICGSSSLTYSWQYSAWGSCIGVSQIRTATCVDSLGNTVANSNCTTVPVVTQPCTTCNGVFFQYTTWFVPYSATVGPNVLNASCGNKFCQKAGSYGIYNPPPFADPSTFDSCYTGWFVQAPLPSGCTGSGPSWTCTNP